MCARRCASLTAAMSASAAPRLDRLARQARSAFQVVVRAPPRARRLQLGCPPRAAQNRSQAPTTIHRHHRHRRAVRRRCRSIRRRALRPPCPTCSNSSPVAPTAAPCLPPCLSAVRRPRGSSPKTTSRCTMCLCGSKLGAGAFAGADSLHRAPTRFREGTTEGSLPRPPQGSSNDCSRRRGRARGRGARDPKPPKKKGREAEAKLVLSAGTWFSRATAPLRRATRTARADGGRPAPRRPRVFQFQQSDPNTVTEPREPVLATGDTSVELHRIYTSGSDRRRRWWHK